MHTYLANSRIYEFDGFRLDSNEQELRRGSERIPLTPKAVELLTVLIERRSQIVTREEILDGLWHDTYVDESNLTVTVSMLRRALGVSGNDKHFIETVPKRGYRFNAAIRTPDELVVERHALTRIKIAETETESQDLSATFIQQIRRYSLATGTAVSVALLLIAGFYVSPYSTKMANSFAASSPLTTRTIAVLPIAFDSRKIGAAVTANQLTSSINGKIAASVPDIISSEAMKAAGARNDNFLIIGKKLKADVVLAGVLIDDPTGVYLRVHLISTGDGSVLWANTYRVAPGDALNLTADIAQNVAGNLSKPAAPETTGSQPTKRYTENEEAAAFFLQGRFSWLNRYDLHYNPEITAKYFEEALKLDPNYSLPMIGLADLKKTGRYDSEDRKTTDEWLRRAIELAPDSADAHASLGFTRMIHDWNWRDAEMEFQTALRIDPACVNALQWYALLLALETRFVDAGEKINLASRYAPFSISVARDRAEIFYLQRKYAEAVGLAAATNFAVPHSAEEVSGLALWHNGEFGQALDSFAYGSGSAIKPEHFAAVFEEKGATAVARLMVERFKRDKSYEFLSSYRQAEWLSYLNERGKALDQLERAADEHHFFMAWIKANPFFENLRGEPRYHALLTRVGLE